MGGLWRVAMPAQYRICRQGSIMTGHANNGVNGGLAAELHYSVGELSALWRFSPKTIRRIFTDEPGVISWGHEEACHKRGYHTLSIPASVASRVHRRMEQGQHGRGGRSL